MDLCTLWCFIIFSFLGWALNVIKGLLLERKIINYGFLILPFCPFYGFLAVLYYFVFNNAIVNNIMPIMRILLIISIFVIFFYFLFKKILGIIFCDFFEIFKNIKRVISIVNTLFFSFIVFYFYNTVQYNEYVIAKLPENVSYGISVLMCTVIAVDFIISLIITIRLKRKINLITLSNTLAETYKDIRNNDNRIFLENKLRKKLISFYPELKISNNIKKISDKSNKIKNDNMKVYTTIYSDKKLKPFACGLSVYKLILLFSVGSFLGSIIEVIWAYLFSGKFEIRVGLVYGPFIPVYGGGVCFLTILLYKLYKLNDSVIFLVSAIVGAGFEYFCSWFQEYFFDTASWNYNNTPLNINGRINLLYTLIWGFMGLMWVRYIYPLCSIYIEKIPRKIGSVVTTFLLVFMIYNAIISSFAVIRWHKRADNFPAENKFEAYLDKYFDDERMEYLFPNMMDASVLSVTS